MTAVELLSSGDRRAFVGDLGLSHERKIFVDLQKLNGDTQERIEAAGYAGQIDIGKGGPEEVQRNLTLSLADRRQVFNFAAAAPGEGIFFDTMVQITDARYSPTLGFWVESTPFTGPIWSFKRQGYDISLTAHSKERLAMGAMWTPANIHPNARRISAIRDLLEGAGEDRFDFPQPSSRGRIPERRGLDRYASRWAHAWKIAQSMNMQLLYTGPGVARLRNWPGHAEVTIRGGEGGLLLGDPAPEVDRSLESAKNLIHVLGKKPKGHGKRPSAVARIRDPNHPLSPTRLGRNGAPRFLVERVEDTSLRTDRECSDLGERILADRIRGIVSASFACAPIPHLDPGDLVVLELPDDSITVRLLEWSLPLLGGAMTVGQFRRSRERGKRKR